MTRNVRPGRNYKTSGINELPDIFRQITQNHVFTAIARRIVGNIFRWRAIPKVTFPAADMRFLTAEAARLDKSL
jgi:hypothetical protein